MPELAPKLIVKETDYGFLYGGRRHTHQGAYHWRVTQWMRPFFSLIPGEYPLTGHGYVPIDDEQGLLAVPRVDQNTLLPVANCSNDYLIDRQMQKTVNYSGIRGISEQDMAMTQSMGAIYDRSQEHLAARARMP